MRRVLAAIGVAVVLCAPATRAFAQTAGDKAAIMALEDGWAKALVKRDKAYFAKTLAPGFVYTEDDRLMTREDVLRDIVTPQDTVISAQNEEMVVHQYGAVTAVVTGLLVIDGRAKGMHYHHRYRFTDTWVKQKDGTWKIVAAEDYLIPAK